MHGITTVLPWKCQAAKELCQVTRCYSDTPFVNVLHALLLFFSQLDIVTHRVLTTLSNTGAGKAKGSKLYDANIACRKLASEHPLLVLRSVLLVYLVMDFQIVLRFV